MEEGKRFDMESLHNPFESNTEWQMRRSFLEAHAGKFPVDRLISMSNCYVSVEMYGCRYPDLVMKQLRELVKDIPEYVPLKDSSCNRQKADILVKATSRKKGVQMLNFVKASVEENWSASTGESTGNQTVDKTSDQTTGSFLFCANDVIESKGITSSPYWTCSKTKGICFGKTSQSSNAGVETREGDMIMINQKFQELSRKICQYRSQQVQGRTMNSVDLLDMVGSECQMKVSYKFEHATLATGGPGFACELFVNCVSVTTGHGSRKNTARGNACKKAVDILSGSLLSIVENKFGNLKILHTDKCNMPVSSPDVVCMRFDEESHLRSQNEVNTGSNPSLTGFAGPSSFNQTGSQLIGTYQQTGIQKTSQTCQKKKCNKKGKKKRTYEGTYTNPSQFILLCHEEDSILSSLNRIADFNKIELTYRCEATGSGWRCEAYLGEFLIANGVGIVQKIARISSAQSALAALKQICWSLKEKKRAEIDETAMTKDDLADLQTGNSALPDSNIGNVLLQKMGWTGGGLGKEGNKGITEPVNISCIVKRRGLGFMCSQGKPKDFNSTMYKFVSGYLQCGNQSDISFSPEFNKEERAIIQKVCKKLNLKAESRRVGKKRFIIMGRKRNALQLLDYVKSSGGSTQRYQVIPPSNLTQSSILDS